MLNDPRDGKPAALAFWIATIADKSKLEMDYGATSVVVVLEGEIWITTEEVLKPNDHGTLKAWGVSGGNTGGVKLQAQGGPATVLIGMMGYVTFPNNNLAAIIENNRKQPKGSLKVEAGLLLGGNLATAEKQSWVSARTTPGRFESKTGSWRSFRPPAAERFPK